MYVISWLTLVPAVNLLAPINFRAVIDHFELPDADGSDPAQTTAHERGRARQCVGGLKKPRREESDGRMTGLSPSLRATATTAAN